MGKPMPTVERKARAALAKTLAEQVRCVLLDNWDPMGGTALDGREDEYDGYVPVIVRMLMDETTSPHTLAGQLMKIERKAMGLDPDPARAAKAVREIMMLRIGRAHTLEREQPSAPPFRTSRPRSRTPQSP